MRPSSALLLILTGCTTVHPLNACPPPLYPDACTVEFLTRKDRPQCVTRWLDRYERQQDVLK